MSLINQTILNWLQLHEQERPNKIAISSPEGFSITYGALLKEIRTIGEILSSHGVSKDSVVLIALPDGPEALISILAVSCFATAFPIQSMAQKEEYLRIIEEISPTAIILEDKAKSNLWKLTEDIELIRFAYKSTSEIKLNFIGSKPSPLPKIKLEEIPLDHPAILIGTSGATSLPKIIASSQKSITTSIHFCADWAKINCETKSLCIMPFAHLHSIVRSTYPILYRGGEVICTQGFNEKKFLTWIKELSPNYLSTVPSIYRSIVTLIERQGSDIQHSFSTLVTGSDYMDADTQTKIEKYFKLKMLQFYGLSEVAPLLAVSDHLSHKKGAVGKINSDWDIKCFTPEEVECDENQEGEIACFGGIINPIVGHSSEQQEYYGNYFRTGDRGHLSEDGYLFVTGRMDDRIHSGGKKIQPSAIEEVFKNIDQVMEVSAFGFDDEIKGQKVGVAVVLQENSSLTENKLLSLASKGLISYMVPEDIIILDKIPKNLAGKVSRKKLASLMLEKRSAKKQSDTDVYSGSIWETRLIKKYQEYLECSDLQLDQSFYEQGGDSLGVLLLLTDLQEEFELNIPPSIFMKDSRISTIAKWAMEQEEGLLESKTCLCVQQEGDQAPIFITHGPAGGAMHLKPLKDLFKGIRPIYTFECQAHSDTKEYPDDFKSIAKVYADDMCRIQKEGAYYLVGYSFGAHLAFEIAHHLSSMGKKVAFVGLIDDNTDLRERYFAVNQRKYVENKRPSRLQWAFHKNVPEPYYGGPLTVFRAEHWKSNRPSTESMDWKDLARNGIQCFDIPGSHDTIISKNGFDSWKSIFLKAFETKEFNNEASLSKDLDQFLVKARKACKQGDLDLEISYYEQALNTKKELPYWVYENLFRAKHQKGDKKGAAQVIFQGIQEAVDWICLAKLMLQYLKILPNTLHKDFLFNKVKGFKITSDIEARFVSNIYLGFGLTDEALRLIEKYLLTWPDSTLIHLAKAEVLISLNELEKAEEMYLKALEIDNSLVEPYMCLANLYQHQGKPNKAETLFDNASKLFRFNVSILEKHGNIKLHCQKESEAIEIFEQCLKMKPMRRFVHFSLIKIYLKKGNDKESISVLKRAIENCVDNVFFLDLLAKIYYKNKKYNKARPLIKQIHTRDPKNIYAILNLSKIAEIKKKYHKAIYWLDKAIPLEKKPIKLKKLKAKKETLSSLL